MDFIDEEDHFSLAVHDLLDNSFQSLLELTLIFRTCDQSAKIQRINLAALEVFRHIAIYYLLGNALRNRCLSHSRLSDQYRIVLCSSAEDLQHPPYLLISSDYRIQLSLRRSLVEVYGKPAEVLEFIY